MIKRDELFGSLSTRGKRPASRSTREQRGADASRVGSLAKNVGSNVVEGLVWVAGAIGSLKSDRPMDEVPWNNFSRRERNEDGSETLTIVHGGTKTTLRQDPDGSIRPVRSERATIKNVRDR